MASEADASGVEAMEELKGRISDCHAEPDDPNFLTDKTLRQYLVARDWNVKAAEKQLRETLEWRRETKPQHVVCTFCQKNPGYHSLRQIGFDRNGRPVLYHNFAQSYTQASDNDDVLQHVTYMFENSARSSKTHEQSSVWVIDFTGMKMTCCNPRLGLTLEHVLSTYYPEHLGSLICVNQGFVFHTVWKVIKSFICQRTADKVYIHRSLERVEEEFEEMFPKELKNWIMEEIRENMILPYPDSQKQFWKQNSKHDPRGCPSFVAEYIDSFPMEDYKNGKDDLCLPHSSILAELCKDAGGEVNS